MKCPLCDVEPKVIKARNVMKGTTLYKRQTFACRNDKCPNFEKEIGYEDTKLEYDVVEEGEKE